MLTWHILKYEKFFLDIVEFEAYFVKLCNEKVTMMSLFYLFWV